MDLHIIAVILLSAALHPFREFWIKGNSGPESLTLAVVIVFTVLSAIHATALGLDLSSAVSVWPLVVVSAVSVVTFYWFLLRTFAHGDLSVYYPITRSSPLFVVIAGSLFLDHSYSALLLLGVALVLVGAFFLQYERGARLLSQPTTLLMAVMTMSVQGVTILADAEAMNTVEPAAFLFAAYLLITPGVALVFAVTRPSSRSLGSHLFGGWRHQPLRFLAAGTSCYLSYYLLLVAFQIGAGVAAASAVRQVSIPISVLMGGMLFGEARMMGRLGWSFVLAIGVAVIILSH